MVCAVIDTFRVEQVEPQWYVCCIKRGPTRKIHRSLRTPPESHLAKMPWQTSSYSGDSGRTTTAAICATAWANTDGEGSSVDSGSALR